MTIYLTLSGIKGESTVIPGAIEIMSFQFGVGNSGNAVVGPGKASLSSITVTTRLSSASPPLFLACLKGTSIPNGTLTFRTTEATPFTFLTVNLTGVLVVGASESSAGDLPSESFDLDFDTITATYTAEKRGMKGQQSSYSWNVVEAHP